ncbi:MAG: mechanosensitive ion channel family protein [Campylobacterota bacterium]|nr:mechanosensitive ion channel family protein [Campylobacterota bacterium]
MKTIKKLLILLIIFSSFTLSANAKVEYTPFVNQQISFISQLQDNNLTEENITNLLKEQENHYLETLEYMISHKKAFIKKDDLYDSEIFRLKKIIKINKRAGNKYAVLRDEVQVNSYNLLRNQNKMMIEILNSLNKTSSEKFKKDLNDIIVKTQLANQEILNLDYQPYLDLDFRSKTFQQTKENIVEFYKLLEINLDTMNHLYSFEDRMYRLSEYDNYNILNIVLFINQYEIVKAVNPILELYGLSVFKIILILVLFSFIYLIRKVAYVSLENYLMNVKKLKKYSTSILKKIRKPIEIIIILINIELTIYIYNNFISNELVVKFFNISYTVLIIWLIYRVLNVIAAIKIHNMPTEDIKLRNGIINVGVKIVNFIIVVIGFLIVLKLAGINLTAVLSGLGIGGIAVALASKDSLSNFFGTISVLLSNVFSQGDWIVVDGKEGVVVEIGLRVTTLRTFDNALIAVPNAILANKEVKNWNRRKLGRRIKMSLGIKYDSSSKDIKNAVDEIRSMLDKHSGIATQNTAFNHKEAQIAKLVSKDDAEGVKKTLLVYLDQFSDSSINILVYCFTKSVDWEEWLQTKEDVMHRIMEIFERNNLEFAFPSLSIYHENDSKN